MRRLLLDFGGVVIRTPFELLSRVGSPEWFGPFDPDRDTLWSDLMARRITEREYWYRRSLELHPDSDDPVRDLMRPLFEPPAEVVVRPETIELLESVESPAVLTNDLGKFHDDAWLALMGLDDTFDPLIDLSYVGFLKPSPEAYTHAVKILDTEPDEIVFVDDQPANAAAAADFGLRAVWFDVTDVEGSIKRVRTALD